MTYPRLRQVVWLCAALPIQAAAEPDFSGFDAPLLTPTFSTRTFDGPIGAVSNLKLDVGNGQAFLDWRPLGGGFFAGTAVRQTPPTNNLSLRPLAPYLGTYLGVGWKSAASSKKFAWMVDVGIVREVAPTVALNIAQSNSHSNAALPSTSYHFSPRGRFSFNMKF